MAPELIYHDKERQERRGDKPMSGAELLEEFSWLIDGGVHPMLAADQLGVKYSTLNRLAARHGRSDLFARVDTGAWDRYALTERSGWGYAA
jgi:hypothetical protein